MNNNLPKERCRGRGFLLAFALCSPWAGPALALHPLLTEDAYTLGKGKAQLEVGLEHFRIRRDGTEERSDLLRPVFSYGVLEN
ncbi:MAG TPA: hypothetical protein VF104_08065, partial [Burkholderiales bacterium]